MQGITKLSLVEEANCRTPLHEECPRHHGHKGDPGVTPRTCNAIGERAPGVGNAFHPRRL